MKKLFVIAMSIASIFVSSPAHAYDDGGDRYGQREGCGKQGGGCNNERDENYSGAGCKYVCPSFDKSPVHDAFNFSPFVCMPGATCYEDGDKRNKKDQPQDPGGK